jgi:hypothetical protein
LVQNILTRFTPSATSLGFDDRDSPSSSEVNRTLAPLTSQGGAHPPAEETLNISPKPSVLRTIPFCLDSTFPELLVLIFLSLAWLAM